MEFSPVKADFKVSFIVDYLVNEEVFGHDLYDIVVEPFDNVWVS